MPKMEFESQETLPEEFRPAAVKDEATGKFVVDLSLTSKVKEFRDTNVTQRRQIEDLTGFREAVVQVVGVENPDDLDLEKFREELSGLREIKGKVDAGKLIADTSLDSAVEQRTNEMKAGYERQKVDFVKKIDEATKRGDGLQARLHEYAIQSEITRAVLAPDSDIRADALPDILNRAKTTFRVDQEKLEIIPYGKDNQPLYGEDPTKVMSPKEWLKVQAEEASYFSKSSTGGGAGGGQKNQPLTQSAGAMPMKDYFAQRKAELKKDSEPVARR